MPKYTQIYLMNILKYIEISSGRESNYYDIGDEIASSKSSQSVSGLIS